MRSTEQARASLGIFFQTAKDSTLRRSLIGYLFFNISEAAAWIALLVWAYGEWGVQGSSAVALAQLVPAALLAAPAAAWLGRRLSRPTVLALGYAGQAVGYALPGVLIALDVSGVAVILAAVVGAVAVTTTRPAYFGRLPEVSRTTADLTAANALSSMIEAVSTMIGPVLCSVAIAMEGPGAALVGCGALMAVATVVTISRREQRITDQELGIAEQGSQVRDVARNSETRVFSALALADAALLGAADILLVVLALSVLDMSEAGPGVLSAALGVGGILGSALAVRLIGRGALAGPVIVGALGAGVAFAVAGFAGEPLLAILPIAAMGAFRVSCAVGSQTLMQRLLPDHLLAAMFGLREALTMAGLALGSLLAPLLVTVAGASGAFVVAGLILPLVAVGSAAKIRALDARTSVPEDVFAALDAVPSLSLLAPRILERMAIDALRVEVEPGAVVVQEGAPADYFYVIDRGELRVTKGGVELRVLVPGQWFGELALLRRSPRTATVTAIGSCVLWAVDRDSFLGTVARSPSALQSAEDHAERHYRE